ncbi:Lipase, secreted [Cordyceps fumosorosea ARSEF 2679]|uniref:Lipase, secreted n=1 Tax=Cordyceps fumosorosea (strain ARSEF 2679) TaxID=1081104 RepID=A0A168EHF9_CORFA|nr:Lipase, secreted [Cordyceps fumosorosea ARSEF 2679]OAA73810.1 Lipase, secreted [Cordyceps fumosorosea ARSEF 2679]
MLGKRLLSAALVGAYAALVAECAPPLPHDPRDAPIVPSQDPFYSVPSDIPSSRPGDILRHRAPPASIAAFGLDPVHLAGSYQLQYRTADNLGNATATVLTVLVPHDANFGRVLSYQVAEDSASPDCAPSYGLQRASAEGTVLTQAELLPVEAALEQGWVVVLPDYEGPEALYLAHRLAGQAVLDGIRAALRSGNLTGIEADATVAMWGYSAGSMATTWAAELQPSYAPELRIAGAAIGGTTPNITNVVTATNGGPLAGLIATGINGLSHQYAALKTVVDKQLKPADRADFDATRRQCLLADIEMFMFRDVMGMFEDPRFVYTDPVAVGILEEVSLGHAAPRIPLYWYKSVHDEVSPVADSDALYDKYCAGGATVEYVRDEASEHGSAMATGAPRALAWLKRIMEGEAPKPGCSRETTLSSLLNMATVEVVPKFILDALLDLVGKPVGSFMFG